MRTIGPRARRVGSGGVARLAWNADWRPPAGQTLAGQALPRFGGTWFTAHPGLLADTSFLEAGGFLSAAQDSGAGRTASGFT